MYNSNYITPFQYLGGKYSVLDWLLPLLSDSYSFVDVFGGSAAVILNKRPSKIDTYNDINRHVVTFFRVLRDQPDELLRALELTPHSKSEYDNAWFKKGDSDLERARKFFVRNRQSFMSAGSHNKLKGWAATTRESRVNMSEATSKWLGSINGLVEVTTRLRSLQIECRSFDWIIDVYDKNDVLFYCDPPYDGEKRSGKNDYMYDFTHEDHIELSKILHGIKGRCAVSGYDSELMRELYSDFQFHRGPERKNNYSKKKGIHECLWTNYDAYEKQPTLF